MKTGDRESGTAAPQPFGDGMRRRAVIAGLTSLLAAPKQSSAQQAPAKIPRVGWIWNGRSVGNPTEVAGFRQGLKELGYVESPRAAGFCPMAPTSSIRRGAWPILSIGS